MLSPSVTQSDVHPTGDQEVVISIPAGSGNIISWRLIMKYTDIKKKGFSDISWGIIHELAHKFQNQSFKQFRVI